MEPKDKKVKRVLDIYNRFLKNEILNKKELADIYNVNEKTIQRDIDDIRCYFTENITKLGENNINYDKSKKGYILESCYDGLNTKSILVLIKVLLESRAFCKEEIDLLSKGLLNIASYAQKKHIIEIIGNEKINYVELSHKEPLIDKIWDLSECIKHRKVTNIIYKKDDGSIIDKKVKPIAIIFSEYYFYLLADFNDYVSANVYRIDKIIEYKELDKPFFLEDNKKIDDGELRKKAQYTLGGKVQRIVFEYYGESVESVLDKLPTGEVISKDNDKKVIKVEILGDGIKKWFLSQGKNVKVLSPSKMVDKMKEEVSKMNKLY